MPKRWCSCTGCPSCGEHAGSHGRLYDADSTRTLRCPACEQAAQSRRHARQSSARRGYGAQHRRKRQQLLEQWQPGDPCAHCHQPMLEGQPLDLAHNEDRTGYRGLAHRECNRGHREV